MYSSLAALHDFSFFVLLPLPPRATRPDTLFPYSTLSPPPPALYICRHSATPHPDPLPARGEREKSDAPIRHCKRSETIQRRHSLWRLGWMASHSLRSRRSEEHTSELQSLMRISYAVFCLKKKNNTNKL